jgi:hypothetical protein
MCAKWQKLLEKENVFNGKSLISVFKQINIYMQQHKKSGLKNALNNNIICYIEAKAF